jgi:hypothetical protein
MPAWPCADRDQQNARLPLLRKFGTNGSINLAKAVPLVGGGVGAGVNVVAINKIARYSRRTFAPLNAVAAQ